MIPHIFYSCSEKVKIQETNKTFYITHDYKPNRILLLNKNKDIFCIAYFEKTNKRIEISNIRNQDKKVIKLPECVAGQYLLSVNPDTVYVYNNIYSEIHLITKNGYVKTFNLLSALGQKNYRFYPPSQIYNNALYISGYHFNKNLINDNSIVSEKEILKQIMQNEKIFIFKNLFTDSIYANQMLSNFVSSEIVKSNACTSTDFLKIRIFKNAIICFHANSNFIYVFNKANGKIDSKVKLISDYSSLKVPLVRLYNTDEEKEEYLKQSQEANFLNGVIYNITFDEFRNFYYVTVLLPNKNFHYLNNLTFERDWSLIVLNEKFKKLGEFFFEKDKFDFRIIHPIKEGIVIAKKYEKDENKKTIFALFQVL